MPKSPLSFLRAVEAFQIPAYMIRDPDLRQPVRRPCQDQVRTPLHGHPALLLLRILVRIHVRSRPICHVDGGSCAGRLWGAARGPGPDPAGDGAGDSDGDVDASRVGL